MSAAVAVFAKAPRPGQVKTRLCPPLSQDLAAGLYAAMLRDVLAETSRAAKCFGFAPYLAVHPASALPEILESAPEGFQGMGQRGSDLPSRLAGAFQELDVLGHAPILVRGSDSPGVTAEHIGRALRALRESDVVLGPDRDGGYHLIGLKTPAPSLFDHPMSRERVLDETLERARALRLRTHCLAPGFDVDTVDDLRFLRSVDPGLCPETLAFAARFRLWELVARS